jgi:hypothetical protein
MRFRPIRKVGLPALRGQRQHYFPAIPGRVHRCGDLVGDGSSGGFHRIAREVRVARRRSRLAGIWKICPM